MGTGVGLTGLYGTWGRDMEALTGKEEGLPTIFFSTGGTSEAEDVTSS